MGQASSRSVVREAEINAGLNDTITYAYSLGLLLRTVAASGDQIVPTTPIKHLHSPTRLRSSANQRRIGSMENYALYLIRAARCSPAVVVTCAVLLDRYNQSAGTASSPQHQHAICSSTAHRIFAATLLLAMKITDDSCLSNRAFARFAHMSLSAMNAAELQVLMQLDGRLFVTAPELTRYTTLLAFVTQHQNVVQTLRDSHKFVPSKEDSCPGVGVAVGEEEALDVEDREDESLIAVEQNLMTELWDDARKTGNISLVVAKGSTTLPRHMHAGSAQSHRTT